MLYQTVQTLKNYQVPGAVAPLALASLTLLGAAPALALSPVTFVSGKGADSSTCASLANPCRSFQFAFGQTSPGGEIKALDAANYGGLTITNSIRITGIEGAGIGGGTANAITINAGPNDTINLSRLTLDGSKTAQRHRAPLGRVADRHPLQRAEFWEHRNCRFPYGQHGFPDRGYRRVG